MDMKLKNAYYDATVKKVRNATREELELLVKLAEARLTKATAQREASQDMLNLSLAAENKINLQ